MSGRLYLQMPKFFVTDIDFKIGNTAYINGEDAYHMLKSLRIRNGEIIVVSNGKGRDFNARVEKIENDSVLVELTEEIFKNSEPNLKIMLYTAITKGEGFEYAIKKCVEAGVNTIIPTITERTIVDIGKSKFDKKYERWNKISAEAAKQSGRSLIPEVAHPVDFMAALNSLNSDELAIICYVEEGTLTLKDAFKEIKGNKIINVFIGPEGGFTHKEIKMAVSKEVKKVTLGNRILKAETAGLFVTAIAMYEFDELNRKL